MKYNTSFVIDLYMYIHTDVRVLFIGALVYDCK